MVELEEPDKGYAWVVAFAAFGINVILAGLIRSAGIIYIQVLEHFQVQRREATIPFSVRSVIRCFSSPLVGIAGNRLGIRMVTAVGGLIAAIGVSLCRIAPNILWLTVFFGVIHGVGFALANTLFQVVVNQYFESYRSTASGIALSGSCIGSFIFPFILESTFEEYNLPGTFLILGGIILHVIPLGLLFKTPPWVRYPKKYAKLKLQQDTIKRSELPTVIKMLTEEQEKSAMLVGKSTLAGATTLGENPGEQLQVLSFQTNEPMKSMAKSLDSGMDLYRKENSSDADNDTVRRASEPTNSSKASVETDDTAFKSSVM